MARRSGSRSGSKSRPASPRKGRGGAKETSFEVEESGGEEAAGEEHGLETGLVFLTFVALLAGFVMIQLEMAEHGAGLFG